jgi:ribonuclease HI
MVLLFGWNMSWDSSMFIWFTNGTNHHTQNFSSTTWVIYSPTRQLVSSGGEFLDPFTNNVVEYSVFIKQLRYAIVNHIRSLVIYLDAQLVLSQLNNEYHVQNIILFCR